MLDNISNSHSPDRSQQTAAFAFSSEAIGRIVDSILCDETTTTASVSTYDRPFGKADIQVSGMVKYKRRKRSKVTAVGESVLDGSPVATHSFPQGFGLDYTKTYGNIDVKVAKNKNKNTRLTYIKSKPHGNVPSSNVSNADTLNYGRIDMGNKMYDAIEELAGFFNMYPDLAADRFNGHLPDGGNSPSKDRCSGSGVIPVYLHAGDSSNTSQVFIHDEKDSYLKQLWHKCQAESPTVDGWQDVPCPDCDNNNSIKLMPKQDRVWA